VRGTQSVTWSEEIAEVEASVEGKFQETDYGVPGSPTLLELVECSVQWPVSIDCVDVSRADMVARVGERETAMFEEALCGLVDDDAWDMEEPDDDDRE
jgi:hypothetical protein